MELVIDIRSRDVLLGCTALLLTKWLIDRSRSRFGKPRLPPLPSPPGYPLIGHLPMLRRDMREVFRRLTNELGGVFSFSVGPQMIVVMSDMDVVKEAFFTKGEKFSDRLMPALLKYGIGHEGSFAFDNGPVWKVRRRFGLTAMRNFGMGKSSMAKRVNEEARILCDSIENNQEVAFNPIALVTNAVANIICSVSFGYRFEYSDPAFNKLVSGLHSTLSGISFFSIGNIAPILFHTPLYSDIRNLIYSIKDLVQGVVSDHQQTLDDRDIRDIVDAYLLEIKQQKERGDKIVFDDARVWRGVFDLFGAGTGTVSGTLMWAILLVAKYPDAMKQVQEEIDRVVGDHRQPSMSDQDAMPLTMATIMEIQRFRPVAPLGIPRFTNQEAEVKGYHIPKGTAVLMNIWELMHSPKYWNQPDKFDPSRFLSDDGKTAVKPENFIPFGIGNRVCMGELLAKMELFLFLTNLLQRFTIRLPDDSAPIALDVKAGIALTPPPYKVQFRRR